ncbi:HAD family hydrolase [Paenibacillus sp. IHB B 3084]|uniref:HAD family hydrolase n=1 Tax=Paenibacillus sp. IHB B 3084 TaxID=867076 RepID=UPI0007205FDF|nr:HAD family hydrolase [Paenibacillus sp. IHB B 3084]ALP38955.1 HAD family hydrolase [Paenibacillus sp. IHB B 3084]
MNLHKKAVFFDVDDTMYDHLHPTRDALRTVLGLSERFPYEEAYHRIRYYSDVLSAKGGLLEGKAGPDELEDMREGRFVLALQEFGVNITREQAVDIQKEYLDRQYRIEPFEGATSLMDELSSAGYLVGLITNGLEDHQMSKIRAMALENHIAAEHIFVSGTVGYAKPDPRIFEVVNERTGTLAEHCCYIGDSWRNDVAGAVGANWRVIWFNHRKAAPESEVAGAYETVASYSELKKLLLPDASITAHTISAQVGHTPS